jgi:hypothetical protein
VIIEDSLYKPKMSTSPLSRSLSKNISAIELNGLENGQARLGPVLQLPSGAQVEVCGDGFNDRMVKIRSNGKYYFAFRSDLA